MWFITIDQVFSYWIYIWFIAYYVLNKTIYIPNPTIALWLVLICSISMCLSLINRVDNTTIVALSIILLLSKGIPLFLLRNENVNIRNDVGLSIVLFVLYCVYVNIIYDTNPYKIYKAIQTSVVKNNNNTPIMYIFTKIRSNYNYLRE